MRVLLTLMQLSVRKQIRYFPKCGSIPLIRKIIQHRTSPRPDCLHIVWTLYVKTAFGVCRLYKKMVVNRKYFKLTLPQGKLLLRLFPLRLALWKEFLHTLRTFAKILYMGGQKKVRKLAWQLENERNKNIWGTIDYIKTWSLTSL